MQNISRQVFFVAHINSLSPVSFVKHFSSNVDRNGTMECKKKLKTDRVSSDQFVLWPSSLSRAGHTKIEVDCNAEIFKHFSSIDDAGRQFGFRRDIPCILSPTSKFRNGGVRHWCTVHQGSYGKIAQLKEFQDTGVKKCDQAHTRVDVIRERDIPVLNKKEQLFGVEEFESIQVRIRLPPGAGNATSDFNDDPDFYPNIEVTFKGRSNERKILKYPAVYIKDDDVCSISPKGILVTPPAALELAFYMMNLSKDQSNGMKPLRSKVNLTGTVRCKHCQSLHEDVGDFFGQNYHKKHLCGQCGREIFGKPNIANPLVSFVAENTIPKKNLIGQILHLDSSKEEFSIWPILPPIFATESVNDSSFNVKRFVSDDQTKRVGEYDEVFVDEDKLELITIVQNAISVLTDV